MSKKLKGLCFLILTLSLVFAILLITQTAVLADTLSAYNLAGFANATTGGGVLAVTNPGYAQVTTPQQFLDALYSNYKNKAYGTYTAPIKVIEIMNDLDLGYTEVGTSVTSSTAGSLMSAHTAPKLHPVLLQTGVSKIDIKPKTGGLTIFSANGVTIRHCNFNIKSTNNIIIRNLKFDELWEWDEASKGDYDKNDWDFITLGNGGAAYNIWIDHCTFTKAYDGIADLKAGCYNITFSWNKITGDDGATNSNSWVRQQFNYLEQNSSSYPMYYWLRTHGFSINDLVTINQGHDKTHLAGSNSLDSDNASLSITFNHEWYQNVWDRNPVRLRAGNVHVYNCYADDTAGLAAKRLRDTRVAAMSASDQVKINGSSTTDPTYNMGVFLNGTISTEGGATLVENSIYQDCLYPLRNNQTDPSDSEYTGKIKATNTIYHMDNADGTVTEIQGNSTDSGSPLGPFQATIIAFSWNGFTTLPYTYTMDAPTVLKSNLASGAGAGVLMWDKSNWVKTSY
jgi:pectate lyase